MNGHNVDQYDYLQCVVYDIHCRPMCRMISKSKFESAYQEGVGLYNALTHFGMQGQPNCCPDFGANVNYRNIYMIPDPLTLTPSHEGKGRVGHVICDVIDIDGKKAETDPRTTAKRQLERLERDFKLTLKSSSEIEFDIVDDKTGKNFGHTEMWSNLTVLDANQDTFVTFLDKLQNAKVDVETLQSEFGPGMYEATCSVKEGIQGPDTTARFKSIAKSFFRKQNMTATFMTKPVLDRTSSGMHFNHSLWTLDGKNAFYDPSSPDKVSSLAKSWLAGLLLHARAITAICCPTINCYRRIGAPWAPTVADWGIQNRFASFRLKVEGTNVYLENRIPSAASNPYLVLAVTIAAGLYGIEKKLTLPPLESTFQPIPDDLETAISCLEADDVIIKALGANVIKQFVYCKREFELKLFAEMKNKSNEEKFEKEREMYFENA